MADARWLLPRAWRTKDQAVGALVEPAVAGGQRRDLGLGDHRHGVEVEGGEALAREQLGLPEMAFDAPSIALGEFVFGEGGEEAGLRSSPRHQRAWRSSARAG